MEGTGSLCPPGNLGEPPQTVEEDSTPGRIRGQLGGRFGASPAADRLQHFPSSGPVRALKASPTATFLTLTLADV